MAQLKDTELIDNALQDGYVTVHDYRGAHLPDLLNEKPSGTVSLFLKEGKKLKLKSNKHDVKHYKSLSENYHEDTNVHLLDGEALKLLLVKYPQNAPFTMARLAPRAGWLFGMPGLLRRLVKGDVKFRGVRTLTSNGKDQKWLLMEYPRFDFSGFSLSAEIGVEGFLKFLGDEKVRYVVVRFFQKLPEIYRKGGDLDLLVSDEDEEKVKLFLRNHPGSIHVDALTASSDYYPPYLANKILDGAVEGPAGSLVPAPDDAFHSLAYHALYHKGFKSGIKSNLPHAAVKPNPDNDYSGILDGMAKDLNIDVEIGMETLDEYLLQVGWRPESRFIREGYEEGWANRLFFSNKRTSEVGLGVYILKEKAVRLGHVDRFIEEIEKRKVTILRKKAFTPEEKKVISMSLRGGNWATNTGKSDHDLTPAMALVLLDTRPYSMFHAKRGEGQSSIEALKTSLRKIFDEDADSMVHSTDNTREAWEYIEACFPDDFDAIRQTVDEYYEGFEATTWGQVHFSIELFMNRVREFMKKSPRKGMRKLIRLVVVKLVIR